jgi:hypothetical protein
LELKWERHAWVWIVQAFSKKGNLKYNKNKNAGIIRMAIINNKQ